MSALTQDQFANLVGGWGFEKFDDGAAQEFKSALMPMLESSIGQSAQFGGRVSMPGEYFGMHVPASTYTSSPQGTNPSMALVTNTTARPALPQTFPLVGGAADAEMDRVFDKLLKQYRQQAGGKLRLKKAQKDSARGVFKGLVSKVFENIRKIAKKTKVLNVLQMKKALKKL